MKRDSAIMRRVRPWLVALCLLAVPALAQKPQEGSGNARPIVFFNDCFRPVRLMISHADQPRGWHPHAWWNFRPGERSYLVWEGRRLTQLDDHDIYFLAESTDGSRVHWGGNDHVTQWAGAQYNLRRALTGVEAGDLVIRLTCERGR